MRLLSAADIDAAWPIDAAIATMTDALKAIAAGTGQALERQALPLPGVTGLLMGAAVAELGLLAKLVSVAPGNPAHGLPGTLGTVLLADPATGQTLALLDGTALTARRTAAVTACAVHALAAPDARQALLIGCGTQATAVAQALDAVRPFEAIAVHAQSPEHVAGFIARRQPGLHARLQPVTDLDRTVATAQVIVTATNSERPVFPASQFARGAHLSAIGSFRAGMCEFDPVMCQQARVFVDSRDTTGREAGELIAARECGWTRASDWLELGAVLAGQQAWRYDPERTTVFKTVGHVLFDLHAARAVYDRALEAGLGTTWSP